MPDTKSIKPHQRFVLSLTDPAVIPPGLPRAPYQGQLLLVGQNEESRIYHSDVLGIDLDTSQGLKQWNFHNLEEGGGVLTVNQDKVEEELLIVLEDNKRLLLKSKDGNINNYSIDQDSGHLMYIEL